jgi:ubiquinone/menaquinone biosynthesis C-methylase UbiE
LTEDPTKGHRWFAAFYSFLSSKEEKGEVMKRLRPRLQGAASGKTLEVGIGPGAGLEYYAPDVELTAVEPDPFMRERCRKRIEELGLEVDLREGAAERLPFSDESFDSVVCSLVLCSVRSPEAALSELKRVLKLGGKYYFYEHVRYPSGLLGRIQDLVRPLWSWTGAGCHPNRRTWETIENAGFSKVELENIKTVPRVPPLILVRPHIIGSTTK